MPPLLSLVTGKVERDKPFQRLVDSIVRYTSVDYELIVADASEVPYVSELPNIKVIHEKPRLSHSKGYNAAFRLASGTFCLWLNDDAEVCPRYDVEAIDFMEAHRKIGLGALHYSENGEEFRVNEAWSVPYANFGIVPREVGNHVGWFDDRLEMYGADNSLAIKILMADYGIADIPAARILHHSEKDQIRADNQCSRMRDNRALTETYMPHRKQWQSAYQRHRVHTNTVYWKHGVRPETVSL